MPQTVQVSQTAPVPPHTPEAEESVLGAMLLSPGAIGAVGEFLRAGPVVYAERALQRRV